MIQFDEIGKIIVIFIISPIILFKAFIYNDSILGLLGILLFIYDFYWFYNYKKQKKIKNELQHKSNDSIHKNVDSLSFTSDIDNLSKDSLSIDNLSKDKYVN